MFPSEFFSHLLFQEVRVFFTQFWEWGLAFQYTYSKVLLHPLLGHYSDRDWAYLFISLFYPTYPPPVVLFSLSVRLG